MAKAKNASSKIESKPDWKEREFGAAWEKQTKRGLPLLSGILKLSETEQIRFVAFPNGYADENPKAPTWRIFKSVDAK